MFYRYFGTSLLVTIATLFCGYTALGEDFANSVNTVRVQSAGNNAVVVDVYLNSSDTKVVPEISGRKYGNNKYVIDLMKVTEKGNVSKDTASSGGLVKKSNVTVGKIGSGTARVLIDLENPNVEVKDVRYHYVKGTPKLAKPEPAREKIATDAVVTPAKPIVIAPVKNPPKVTPSKAVETKPVAKQVVTPKAVSPKPPVISKNTTASNIAKPAPANTAAKPVQSNANVIGPEIVHKTNSPQPKPKSINPVANNTVTKMIKPQKISLDIPETKPQPKKVEEKVKYIKPLPVQKPAVPVKAPSDDNRQLVSKVTRPALAAEKPAAHDVPEVVTKAPEKPHIEKKPAEPVSSGALIAQAKPVAGVTNKPKPPTDPEQTPLNFDDKPVAGSGNVRDVTVKPEGLDLGATFFTFIGALVVVIPLIIIATILINMFYKGGDSMRLRGLSNFGGNKFKILSSTSLGQGKSIHLVEIKGRQLVIGCTNNSINILTEFGDFDEFVEVNKDTEDFTTTSSPTSKYKRSRPPLGSFADLYKDYQRRISDDDLEDEI